MALITTCNVLNFLAKGNNRFCCGRVSVGLDLVELNNAYCVQQITKVNVKLKEIKVLN
jgi:hypothetical protein